MPLTHAERSPPRSDFNTRSTNLGSNSLANDDDERTEALPLPIEASGSDVRRKSRKKSLLCFKSKKLVQKTMSMFISRKITLRCWLISVSAPVVWCEVKILDVFFFIVSHICHSGADKWTWLEIVFIRDSSNFKTIRLVFVTARRVLGFLICHTRRS